MRDKIIKILITILFIQLPFLDMIRSTSFRHFEVFGISLIELLNILLIGITLVLTVFKLFKDKKKEIVKLVGLLILIGIYVFLHYQNIIKFDTNIFERANFNFITETFYICRVYVLPLMLFYILIENRDVFNKEFYFKIAKIVIAIISFSIIILNILKLSFVSYSLENHLILNNMFDFFLYQGDYKLLASRGWFDSANELSAILFMLLPINIYLLYKENKKINIILFAAQFIAMILLGTRTSAFGAVLISIAAAGCYFITVYFKKEKYKKTFVTPFIIISLVCTAYMCISPFMFGRINDGAHDFSVKDRAAYDDLENADEDQLDALIEKYKDEYLINDAYLKMYPLKSDKEFWLSIAKRDKSLNSDNRKLKTDIIDRVQERNNNEMDKYLGLGYTLNFMDLERDYVYQYYIFGIFGLILLIGPYFAALLFFAFKAVKKFNDKFNFVVLLGFMSPILGLLIAYYSGHVFGWVSPTLFLVMVLGLLGTLILNDKNSKEKMIKNEKK